MCPGSNHPALPPAAPRRRLGHVPVGHHAVTTPAPGTLADEAGPDEQATLMLDTRHKPGAADVLSANPSLVAALEQAAGAVAWLDQALDNHPLRPALLYRARLKAVRRQARPPAAMASILSTSRRCSKAYACAWMARRGSSTTARSSRSRGWRSTTTDGSPRPTSTRKVRCRSRSGIFKLAPVRARHSVVPSLANARSGIGWTAAVLSIEWRD